MVKTYIPHDQNEATCPSCGASIRAPASPRSRRVQCPKCREVIVIESRVAKGTAGPDARPASEKQTATEDPRIAALEARVAALETALVQVPAAGTAEEPRIPNSGVVAAVKKLLWVGIVPGQAPKFSAEQGQALANNLGTVAVQAITIRVPSRDPVAREHAEWFGGIFRRAGWTVRGPEEIAPETAGRILSLAVPELPVAEDAAKTYLALRAAGFEPIPILDSAPSGDPGAPSLTLTIPPATMP